MMKANKVDRKKRSLKNYIFNTCEKKSYTSRTELVDAQIFERNYYKFIVVIFRFVQLWPYSLLNQRRLSTLLPILLFYTLTVTIITPQILRAIEGDFDIYDCVITYLTIFFHLICVTKYTAILWNRIAVKKLCDAILNDWQTIIDEKERDILVDGANKDSFYPKTYIAFTSIGVTVIIFVQLIPIIAQTFFGIWNDKFRALLNPGNYIVELGRAEDIILWFHYSLIAIVNLAIISSIDVFLIMCTSHISAMFDILSYRLNRCGSKIHAKNKFTITDDSNYLLKELKKLVILHAEILKNVVRLEKTLSYSFFIVEVVCLTMLPLALFACYAGLKYPILTGQGTIFLVGFILELFILNAAGQRIIDQSEKVSYSVHWYNLPVECQRFLRLIMVRSVRSNKLTAGKLSTLSLPAYLSIMKTIFSIYTVLVSVF